MRTAVSTSGPPALLDDAIETILATARLPRERGAWRVRSGLTGGPWWTSPWCWCFGLRRSEAAVLVWSDIERWDDSSSRLLIEGTQPTRPAWARWCSSPAGPWRTLDEIQQLHGNASPAVFGMTAKTIKPPVKGAGLVERFYGNCDRWYSSVGATKYTQDESEGHAAR